MAQLVSHLLLGGSAIADLMDQRSSTAELEDPSRGDGARFGKMLLDQKGLISFKRESLWLASVDALPTTVIYIKGERVKIVAGGGWEQLQEALKPHL